MGIEMAQQGRKMEALAYLRRAVTTEALNAEVWLWLAHVSPDINEYQNCVHQALAHNPQHPTAQRMWQDIEYQSGGMSPPMFAAEAAQTMSQSHNRQTRLRRLLILLNVIMITFSCGVLGRIALERLDVNDLNSLIPFLESSKRIQFAVGDETNAVGFQVDVPKSWFLADRGSPSWRAERDRLQREFPPDVGEDNFWRDVETDLGEVTRHSLTGEFEDNVTILETDSELIQSSPDTIANLSLIAVNAISDEYPDNSCENLRQLAADERRTSQQSESFIDSEVRERDSGDCITVSEFLTTTDDNVEIRLFRINIPVAEKQLALWNIVIPDALYADSYRSDVEQIIDSLRYNPGK